ncbi:hypothetical protein M5689_012930 [Euphorbia peplus]|nr:hypothetical protein M5689_012930 [Euphorbia peplus]
MSSSEGPHPWRFDPFTGQQIRPRDSTPHVIITEQLEATRAEAMPEIVTETPEAAEDRRLLARAQWFYPAAKRGL